MKRVKRIALFFILLGVMPSAWCGLENSSPEQRAQLQTAYMKEALSLDAQTLSKVQAINLKYAKIAEPVLKGDDNMFKKRSKMHDIMDAKDQELKGVLSGSQFELYDSKKEELKSYLDSHLP